MPIASDMHYTWLYSDGGPLIPEAYLQEWEGIDPPSNKYVLPDALLTDYDRACEIRDYLGLLKVGEGWGLVLNDAPDQTMWWPDTQQKGGMFVRWIGADDEESVLESLAHIPEEIWGASEYTLVTKETSHYLFDSAWPGDEIKQLNEFVRVELVPGTYSVTTVTYQPDKYTSLLLHRLLLNHSQPTRTTTPSGLLG